MLVFEKLTDEQFESEENHKTSRRIGIEMEKAGLLSTRLIRILIFCFSKLEKKKRTKEIVLPEKSEIFKGRDDMGQIY